MAAAAEGAALDDLQTEMVDRFGPLPPPSVTLLQIHRLRLRAASLGIRRLEIGTQAGRVEFGTAHRVDPARVIRLMQHGGGRYRLDGEQRLRVKLEAPDAVSRFQAAAGLLDSLGG